MSLDTATADQVDLDLCRDDAAREVDLQKIADVVSAMPKKPGKERVPLNEGDFFPSGAVARAFILDPAPHSLICGPWGSGKTTALFIKGVLCACAVPPSPLDGVRYARGVVVRDTYRNLQFNTIPSWQERFPPDIGTWKGGGGGEPASHVIDFLLADGTTLHLAMLFVAVGDHNVKQFCDGLQVTLAILNGEDELPPEMRGYMRPRTGRWPAPQHRPADWKAYVKYWRKLMGDMNAPELDNHTVKDFQTKPLPGYKLFLQPSGLSPEAENMENLPDGYYQDLAACKEEWWIKRFIENLFGYSRSGKPVYTKFNPAVHVARVPLLYDPKRLMVIGLDAQRDACGVAQQKTMLGQLRWLREFIPPVRMGAKQFGKWLAGEMALAYPDLAGFEFSLDPSGFDPNGIDDDFVYAEVFGRAFGLGDEWSDFVKPAATNFLDPRIEVVASALAETDGFLMCPDGCPKLQRAFMSGYRFGDTTTHGDEILTGDPIKNEWSHPMEAGQYGALRLSNRQILSGRKPKKRGPAPRADWHPHDF